MQQRTRHCRSGPRVREPTVSWTLSHLLSVPGRSPHPPSLPWPSCGRGRPLSQLQRLKKGVALATPVAGGKRGQEFTAGAVVSDQLCLPPRGRGDSSVGGRSPHLQLPGLLRGDKGVQSPWPRWKPHSLLCEVCRDHRYLDVCAMD